jgi:uncharacterized protein (DUF433 family)
MNECLRACRRLLAPIQGAALTNTQVEIAARRLHNRLISCDPPARATTRLSSLDDVVWGIEGDAPGVEDGFAKVRSVFNLDLMNLERITLDPAVMSGKPCIRGLRVTVANVLRQLANQRTVPQILEAYPYLEPADIDACLGYAALRVDDEELALSAA